MCVVPFFRLFWFSADQLQLFLKHTTNSQGNMNSDHQFAFRRADVGSYEKKTSVSHPLRCDVVTETPDHSSVIALTLQPGKTGVGQTNTMWERDLTHDIQELHKQKYNIAYCLLTDVCYLSGVLREIEALT
jgi:hypothetical protein